VDAVESGCIKSNNFLKGIKQIERFIEAVSETNQSPEESSNKSSPSLNLPAAGRALTDEIQIMGD